MRVRGKNIFFAHYMNGISPWNMHTRANKTMKTSFLISSYICMLRSFTREYVFLAFCSHFYKQEVVPLFLEQVHIDVHLFAEALSCKKRRRVTLQYVNKYPIFNFYCGIRHICEKYFCLSNQIVISYEWFW